MSRQAIYTPEQMVLRRRQQRKQWRDDNKCWWYAKVNEVCRQRYETDVVYREERKASANSYNRRMRAVLALLLVSFRCFGQDLNPAHAKVIEPKLVIPVAAIARGTTNINLRWPPSPDTNASGYNVYVGMGDGNYDLPIQLGSVTNATVYGLLSGATYHFAITARANGEYSESPFSGDTALTNNPLVLIIKFPQFGTNLESSQNLGIGTLALPCSPMDIVFQ